MDELEMYEGDDFEIVKDARKTTLRFLRSLGKQRIRLLIVLISVAIYSVLNILAPLYSATAVDIIWDRIQLLRKSGESFSITWSCGGRQVVLLLCIYLAASAFYVLQNFLMASFAEKLNLQLRGEIAEKLH